MRRHAKASLAGSTPSQRSTLGRIVRGSLATGASSPRPEGGSTSSHRFLFLFVIVLSALAVLAPSASAKYVELGSFADNGAGAGGSGSENGQLSNPGQTDVNSTTGDLYIADTGNDRVQRFEETPTAASYASQVAITAPTGLAIDQSDGSVYVSNGSGISKFTSSLTPAGGWSDPGVTGALAVDPTSGDLLVADTAANLIRRFESDGTPAGTFAAERPIDLAVTASGKVLVITSTGDLVHSCGPTSAVREFSAAGADEGLFNSGLQYPGAIAIDSDDGTVLVATFVNEYWCEAHDLNPRIVELDSQGILLVSFKSPQNLAYAMVPALAVGSAGSQRAYFVTKSPENDSYGPTKAIALENLLPPSVAIDPVDLGSVTSTEATLEGSVNPGGNATNWHFEFRLVGSSTWISTAMFIGGSGEAGSGESAADVEAALESLEPNAEYEARLAASSEGGNSASGAETFTTDPAAPRVDTLGAQPVQATQATLHGVVHANNSQTEYWFEWGSSDCSSSSCMSIPAGQDGDAGSSFEPEFVSETITGLDPGATYHYRLMAGNSQGIAAGEDRTFTTAPASAGCPNATLRIGASADLPDCRADEMVSPLQKNGGHISGSTRRTRVATDGNAVSYMSQAGFAGAYGYSKNGSEYLSRRSDNGWTTYPISPQVQAPIAPSIFTDSQYVGTFSSDLSHGVFRALNTVEGHTPPNVLGSANLFLGENLGSSAPGFTAISNAVSPLPAEQTEFDVGYVPPLQFADASDDFSHIIFESKRNLTADASGEENKVYEWVEGQGLRLAGILPDSACATPPCAAASALAGGGALTSFKGDGDFTEASHVISEDGSRVFFTDKSEGKSDLYLRENGTTTVRIDASERSEPIPGNPGASQFQYATPDGSKVFFLSWRALTDDDIDLPGEEDRDLYRYDVDAPEGEHLTLLTPNSVTRTANYIKYVPGVSDDGEYVYALGVADPSEGGNGTPALLLLHDGEARVIATTTSAGLFGGWGEGGAFGGKEFRMTPNGRFALFSAAKDNGFTLNGHQGLFLYKADSNQLLCISCNSGGSATGDASFTKGILGQGDSGDQTLSHPLTDDGHWAFFTTEEALVPGDTNGKFDAYEYDVESDKVALLSSGECNCDSAWVGASPNGNDAFFVTREQLVRADADNLNDMYDARVDGGIAAQNQLPPASCEGDACQPAPVQLNDPTPASESFVGAGNPPSNRARGCSRRRKHHRGHSALTKREKRKQTTRCKSRQRRAER